MTEPIPTTVGATGKAPLTMQRIGDLYTWAYAWDTAPDPDARPDLVRLHKTLRTEFDAALAAHDAAMRATASQPVLALHRANTSDSVARDCAFGKCDHDDECPTTKVLVCEYCEDLRHLGGDPGETSPMISWPCPTAIAAGVVA